MVARIKVAGEELTIAGTHLTYHSDASTTDQVASLLKHLPKDNLLFVAGDFDAKSDSPAVESMTRAGFKDALPGDINHLFVPNEEDTGWRLGAAVSALDVEPRAWASLSARR